MINRDSLSEITPQKLSKFQGNGIFLIVTANQYECEALEEYYKDQNLVSKYKIKGITANVFAVCAHLGRYNIMHLHLPNQGSTRTCSSTDLLIHLNEQINFRAVFLAGIAFGIDPDKQNIGDILISEQVLPYEVVKVNEESTENRNKAVVVNGKIVDICRSATDSWRSNYKTAVHFGAILTGEKLVNSSRFKKDLLQLYEEQTDLQVVGGEMEGTGACISLVDRTDFIIVKAICDWGVNKTEHKEERQIFAANNCMHFMYSMFCEDLFSDVYRAKKCSHTEIPCYQINGYKMFYYRQLKGITLQGLTNKTKINSATLEAYETINHVGSKDEFHVASISDIKKIERALNCSNELVGGYGESLSMKTIYKNREKNMLVLIPVSDIKAVVFDFDGTLTVNQNQKSSWQKIWELLGDPNNLCVELLKQYKSQEISHSKWCQLTEEYFKKKGLTENQVRELARSQVLIKGFHEVLNQLNELRVSVFICSGSVNTFIDEAIPEEDKPLIKDIRSNVFIYNNGLLNEIRGTKFDFDGKRKFVEKIMRDYRLSASEVAFVGNSDNDIYVHRAKVRTIAVNPNNMDPHGKEWVFFIDDFDDLHKILPFLLPTKFNIEK